MVRLSKPERHRSRSPRKPKIGSVKTGPKKDNLPQGFKQHENVLANEMGVFIPKIK